MPRLFTSTRQPPHPDHHQNKRARLPTERPAVDIAMPSPSPPPQSMQPLLAARPAVYDHPKQQQAGDSSPLVLVPPAPKAVLRLMDSHDLDNPYLIAAFNVLTDNDNNPMRVPDILQAVQRKGWTQVLHKHKDRPEQLFGNALRSHQRRRENLGLPSLVFMIDAGACWKHHEMDLSAASGRKKGKIWCFSKDAGYPCPYERLGMDLEVVKRSQHGPGGAPEGHQGKPKEARMREDSDAEDEDAPPSTSAASRKKRKVIPAANSKMNVINANTPNRPLERFEPIPILPPAVRGNVIPVHSVASSLEPPPYIPAATIVITPHNNQSSKRIAHNGRSTRSAARVQPAERSRGQRRVVSGHSEMELDLEGLEAMTPEPETEMGMEGDNEEDGPEMMEEDEMAEPVLGYGAVEPFSHNWTTVTPERSLSLALSEMAYISESDDDEDDFHVTMQEFSDDEDMSAPVIKREESVPPSAFNSLSPIDDFDSLSSDGGASITRTPTPGLPSTAMAMVAEDSWGMFEGYTISEGPFHGPSSSFGLGIHGVPNWDVTPERILMSKQRERINQGWSRAASPEFSERAHRLMGPSPLDVIEFDAVTSAAQSPASCVMDSSETNTQEGSSRSTSRCPSLVLSVPPTTPLSELTDPMSSASRSLSRRSSFASISSSSHLPHPLILYSPCLSPTVSDVERPLKCGLAHRYIFPSEDSTSLADDEFMMESPEVRELEGLLNLGSDDGEDDASGSVMENKAMSISPLTLTPFNLPRQSTAYTASPLTRSPSPIVLY
ncbi:hypothetical protein FRB94_014647 [Tulasnella sp. JGI-2019a]|nr:hypothetical protein FRB93_002464 [Tulasnella sp. JGI-2019a]KAG9007079.1 hypothetical protein FRB94_014647 [Tulasnella sp. JGI-2019a]